MYITMQKHLQARIAPFSWRLLLTQQQSRADQIRSAAAAAVLQSARRESQSGFRLSGRDRAV